MDWLTQRLAYDVLGAVWGVGFLLLGGLLIRAAKPLRWHRLTHELVRRYAWRLRAGLVLVLIGLALVGTWALFVARVVALAY